MNGPMNHGKWEFRTQSTWHRHNALHLYNHLNSTQIKSITFFTLTPRQPEIENKLSKSLTTSLQSLKLNEKLVSVYKTQINSIIFLRLHLDNLKLKANFLNLSQHLYNHWNWMKNYSAYAKLKLTPSHFCAYISTTWNWKQTF